VILGYDKGASAVKLVAIDGDTVLLEKCVVGSVPGTEALLSDFLTENGIGEEQISLIGTTGVGAENCRFGRFTAKVRIIPEIEATGAGGLWLSGLDESVIVSIGTGTAIILAKNGRFTHIGGSGVGSGTLRGLAKKMFGITDLRAFFALAEKGDRLTVDITIGDLFSGTDTLPLNLTASNLAKASEGATEADWARALVNTVMEVSGSHAALACRGFGVTNVVITGGISQTAAAKAVYDNFSRLYQLNYSIPGHSGYATAIGAARRAGYGI
jgi:type II pantothenate kinase